MRKVYGTLVLGAAMAVSAGCASAQVSAGATWDRGGLDHLHVAIGDVYGMPVTYAPSYIHPDELPVVYLLAREAGVAPEVVMALREQGWSWLDITHYLRVDPYLYVSHLPYSRGYWGWQRGRSYRYLTDRHIIDYVNLYFWATYHRRPVTQIIVIRQRIPTWHYYVVYHSPRVVYRSSPPRYTSSRRGEVDRRDETDRRAQPRGETQRTPSSAQVNRPAVARDARTGRQTIDVRDLPSRAGARTAERTPDRATVPSRPARPTTREATPQRPTQVRPPTRPTTGATRPATPQRPTQRVTPPSRPTTGATRPATPQRPTQRVTPPSRPAPQATRPATPPRSAPQATRPAAPTRSAPQVRRPSAPTRSAPQVRRPAAPSRPAAQPSRSSPPQRPARATRPSTQQRPSAQPSRPAASRPAATQRSRPSTQRSRPATQQRPSAQRSSGSRDASSSRARPNNRRDN